MVRLGKLTSVSLQTNRFRRR